MLEDIGPFDHIQADLGDSLRSLAEDVTRAGLPVTLDIEPATSLPPALQLTVYRIAQEALTNALKYAAGATATIRVLRQGDQLDVSVTNTAGSASPQGHVNGSGLAGLQERVALFSGTLSYGADSAGGFSLHARLPCESGG